MDEFDRAVSDHFRGLVTEDGPGARADLDEIPCRIRHQDEVLRSLEDAPPFLDFLIERRLCPLAVGDVVRGFGDADDFTRDRPDRGDA